MESSLQRKECRSREIASQLEAEILSGKIAPGAPLASVRTLAGMYGVGPRILNGRKPEADAAAGLASTVTGNAIERSRLEGKIVTIAPEEYLVKIDPGEKK